MLEKVRSWFNGLPKFERNLPLIILDSIADSPNEVLSEVEAGTELGAKLQGRVEARAYGTSLDLELALAEKRIEMRLKETPAAELVRLVPPGEKSVLTAEEQLEAIRERTPLGMELLENEIRYMMRIKERYG